VTIPDPTRIFIYVEDEGPMLGSNFQEVTALIRRLREKYKTHRAIVAEVPGITHWYACRAKSGDITLYFGTPDSFDRWRGSTNEISG